MQFSGGQSPRSLGAGASAAAFAPGGGALVAAVDDGHGGSNLLVSASDGSSSKTLTDVSGRVVSLTWSSNDRIVYATAQAVGSVTLAGTSGPTTAAPGGAGSIVRLAPGGGSAYLSDTGSAGTLWNIAGGTTRPLSGASGDAVFSSDGTSITWVDSSNGGSRLLVSPVDRDAAVAVPSQFTGAKLSAAALNTAAAEIAYVVHPATAEARLVIAQLPGGAVLATGPAATVASFSASGDAVAMLVPGSGGLTVQRASVPGSSGSAATTVPVAAVSSLNAFVDAQVRGARDTLGTLSGPGVDAPALTPGGLSRAYVVDASVSRSGGVKANVTLIVDPSSQHPTARIAAESIVLNPAPSGSGYLVTALDVSALRDEASGPHVMHVDMSRSNGRVQLTVSFDSDLDPASVANAIAVILPSGDSVPISTTYDAESRTAAVVLQQAGAGPYTVQVATTLRDVDGTPLAMGFSGSVDG